MVNIFMPNSTQALMIRRTDFRFYTALVLASLMLFAFILPNPTQSGRLIWSTLFASPFGVALLAHMALGATCEAHLRTAAQIVRLKGLGRMGRARKVFSKIREEVDRSQVESAEGLESARESVLRQQDAARLAALTEPMRLMSPQAHLFLFLTLMVDALGLIAILTWYSPAVALINLGTFSMGGIVLLVTLMRQHDSLLPAVLKRATWAVFWYFVSRVFVLFFHALVVVVQLIDEGNFVDDEFLAFAFSQSPADNIVLIASYASIAFGGVVLAFYGVPALLVFLGG